MFRSQPLGAAGRVKGIAIDKQTGNLQFVGNHGGHPPAHRLAPDDEILRITELADDISK